MSMTDSTRKVALVVGVGSRQGLGAAIARRFASGGFHVLVAGRTAEKVQDVARDTQERSGGSVAALVGDASVEADARRFVEQAAAAGDLDVVLYNAGSNRRESIFDVTPQTFELFWREHTLGGFLVGQAAAREMRRAGKGSIFFTGASGSLRGKAGFAGFAAAKAGLRAVAQSMARELGPLNIHVGQVIVDGGIEGERFLSRFPDEVDRRGPDGLLKIEAIADTFWYLHHQHRSAWTLELDVRPWAERF
jgi:NAD(P)-dependent dehydrogenase (short-subunit alcohol dehydrogenase family)